MRPEAVAAAIADLTAAIALNPNDALAYRFRGSAYAAKRDLKRAGLDDAAALRLNPKVR